MNRPWYGTGRVGTVRHDTVWFSLLVQGSGLAFKLFFFFFFFFLCMTFCFLFSFVTVIDVDPSVRDLFLLAFSMVGVPLSS